MAVPHDATTQALDRREVLQVLWPVVPGILLGALDAPMVATALGGITDDLGQLDVAAWVVTAYLLTASASAVTYGRLGDVYGRRRVLQFATVIFIVGAMFAGLSQTMGQLIVARAIQGAGGGGLVAVALAALADSVPARARGRYLGYTGALFAAANLIGPLLAAGLLAQFGWRAVFLVNVPLGVVGLVAGSARHHPTAEAGEARGEMLDITGSVLLALVVTGTLLCLRRVEAGLGSPEAVAVCIALVAIDLVLVAWFLMRQRRAEHPLLPPAMLTNPAFILGICGIAIASFVMFASFVYVPLYFQIVSPVSGVGTAFLLTPFMAGFLVGTVIPARTIGRTGRYKRYPVLGSLFMLVGVVLLSTVGPDSIGQARVFLAITGVGVGLTTQVLLLVVQNGVGYTDLGTATSATALVRSVGGAAGIAAFSTVIGSGVLSGISKAHAGGATLTSGTGEAPARLVGSFTSGLNHAFLLAAPLVVLSFLLAMRLHEQPLRESVRGD
jgi:MFS family permease